MADITIVGVGFAGGQLTEAAQAALTGGARVLLHTDRCPCAEWLRARGIPYESLDDLYESLEDFDVHAEAAAARVLAAAQAGDVVYGVLDVRDRSVGALLAQARAEVIPGPPAEDMLMAHAQGATLLLEASDWENFSLQATQNALVREIDSRALAAEVKLKLMECYPEAQLVWVRQPEGGVARTELYNLDRLKAYDHRTSAFVPACPDLTALERYGLEDLVRLVARLCGPDGCPWDRSQTHESLRGDLIEEAYEVADAIDRGDEAALIEELGDILFGVALHAEIARNHGTFDLRDVTSGVVEKMIFRHPHVFAGAENPADVDEAWQALKRQEHGHADRTDAMRAVARALPALKRAQKVLERAGEENEDKLVPAADGDAAARLGAELLALVDRARREGIDAEAALAAATDAFIEKCGKNP